MEPSGHTQPFAVLGHPIGHTLSPRMHNAALRALGLDAIYLAFDVAPERLLEALGGMAALGFRGVNLTVPLKEVAFRGLAQLDESARLMRAVNTVAFTAGGLVGYNTDGYGFTAAFREAFGVGVEGRCVFVLGAGGAGRAVALTCARQGAARVQVTDTDSPRAEAVAREAREAGSGTQTEALAADARAIEAAARQADIVVQATPIGMKRGDPSVLAPAGFRPGQLAYDLIYMYPETPFMAAARAGGARCANGLGMLLHQGARALAIWTGREPPVSVMRAALESAVYGTAPGEGSR